MKWVVIDTNVLLVANGQHADVSDDCVEKCIQSLKSIMDNKDVLTVIDDEFRILREYQNKTQLNPPKGVGDVFLKWLLRQSGNLNHVEQVSLTEVADNEFIEFPDAALQPQFDAPDRKFAAVAHAHSKKPPVLQAADCKWLDWWQPLLQKGVHIEFLCPDDACRFYSKKFPNKSLPSLPS